MRRGSLLSLCACLLAAPADARVMECAIEKVSRHSLWCGRTEFWPLGIHADERSIEAFREHANGRLLRLELKGRDRHGVASALAYFAAEHGDSIQLRLLRVGKARIFSPINFDGLAGMLAAEEEARRAKLGRWRRQWRLKNGEEFGAIEDGFAVVVGRVSHCKTARRGMVMVVDKRTGGDNGGFRALITDSRKPSACPMGETLRFRGFVEDFAGAFMTVVNSCLIERLSRTGKTRLLCESN